MTFKNFYRINELKNEGIGARTAVYKLLSEGKLVAVKNGRATLITGESVRAYMESLPRAEIGPRQS